MVFLCLWQERHTPLPRGAKAAHKERRNVVLSQATYKQIKNFQYNRSIVEVFGRSGRRAGPHDAVDKTFEV